MDVTTTRPGGRTARVRAAVLRASGDALVELGLHGLELADVARRAGVGKTTVYRRWGSVPALLTDLLADMAATSAPRTDHGSLEADLLANALLVQSTLADPRQGALLAAFIGAAACDPVIADGLRRFYAARLAEWAPCVTAAVRRGELPAGTDAEAVVAAVSAPLYYQRLARGAGGTAAPTPDDARRAAAAAAAAARARIFTTAR